MIFLHEDMLDGMQKERMRLEPYQRTDMLQTAQKNSIMNYLLMQDILLELVLLQIGQCQLKENLHTLLQKQDYRVLFLEYKEHQFLVMEYQLE